MGKEDQISKQIKASNDKSKNVVESKKVESIADQLATTQPNNKKPDQYQKKN